MCTDRYRMENRYGHPPKPIRRLEVQISSSIKGRLPRVPTTTYGNPRWLILKLMSYSFSGHYVLKNKYPYSTHFIIHKREEAVQNQNRSDVWYWSLAGGHVSVASFCDTRILSNVRKQNNKKEKTISFHFAAFATTFAPEGNSFEFCKTFITFSRVRLACGGRVIPYFVSYQQTTTSQLS